LFYLFVGLNQEASGWNNVIQFRGVAISPCPSLLSATRPTPAFQQWSCVRPFLSDVRSWKSGCWTLQIQYQYANIGGIWEFEVRWSAHMWKSTALGSFLRFLEGYGYLTP
jgi:hypothetical protein